MGTPYFAVPTLKKLIEHHEVVLVVTQPDKQSGRGRKVEFSDVKKVALENEIEVFQPERIRKREYVEYLQSFDADLFIVVAYGQILSQAVLDIPKLGCINIHGSILPKLRGAAPIHFAIINGEEETGVTIMYMDKGMDTGDIISIATTPIHENDTTGDIHDVLCELGADELIKVLEDIQNGTVTRTKQNDDEATYASLIDKELGHIDFNKSTKEVHNLIRGLTPFPGSYFFIDDVKYKVTKAIKSNNKGGVGTVLCANAKEGLVIGTNDGSISILSIQKQGSKNMDIKSFFNGHSIEVGTKVK